MDLERFVPALLAFVSNRLTNSGSATYRRHFGIGMMDFRIMAMLSLEPGASGARIAEVVALDKAAVSRTLKSLDRRGFVTAKSGHGRARALTLTVEGRAVYKKAWVIARERERRLLIDVSPEEQEILRDLLRRLLASSSFVEDLARE